MDMEHSFIWVEFGGLVGEWVTGMWGNLFFSSHETLWDWGLHSQDVPLASNEDVSSTDVVGSLSSFTLAAFWRKKHPTNNHLITEFSIAIVQQYCLKYILFFMVKMLFTLHTNFFYYSTGTFTFIYIHYIKLLTTYW